MPIKRLPEHIASRIAAGEVVERPASVVKELVENALDASATRIHIQIRDGGRTLIEVEDDGVGIPADQVHLAVERYSTSKLTTIDDIFAIKTLGFRGEALSSIASVSRMQITTRSRTEAVGTQLIVDGGGVAQQQSVGVPVGTSIKVQDLFFNVPARYKFMKKDATEQRKIKELVVRYAMAYPDVAFNLETPARTKLQTSGNGDRREVMAAVYGAEAARKLIHIPLNEKAPVGVQGFVSPPGAGRSNRREITFFVNGRWVQDASLTAAVIQAYHTLLMVGRFPLAALFLDVPVEKVDVNVHPTKAEIRFSEQQLVFQVVQRTVRAALLGQSVPPDYAFTSAHWQPDRTAHNNKVSWDWVAAGERSAAGDGPFAASVQSAMPTPSVPLLRALGQFSSAFIVAEGPDGLYLVDQHAAHERVLFEKLMRAADSKSLESQQLLQAETVELTPAQAQLLEENIPVLAELGFEIEPFGTQTFRIRSLPVLLAHMAPEKAIRAVVEDIEEDEVPLQDEVEARLAARVCKSGAVKSGQILSLAEQEQLIRSLESCDSPRTCPHGRPTMIHISVDALEKQFGRRGGL